VSADHGQEIKIFEL